MRNRGHWMHWMLAVGLLIGLAGCSDDDQNAQNNRSEDQQTTRVSDGGSGTGIAPTDLAAQPVSTDSLDPKAAQNAQQLINRGVAYLLETQNDDGGWGFEPGKSHPALTALALKTLVQHPSFSASSPTVAKGFEVLLSYQQPDGGIYDPQMGQANYTTASAVMALTAAKQPQFQEPITKAVDYLRSLLIVPGSTTDEGDTIDQDHPFRGGVSYGKHGRPDMSNVSFWMQAMEDAGVPGDDPAIQEALVFVTHTQNISETNPRPFAQVGVSDGGFIYAPALKGQLDVSESKAGPGPGGRGLRSYGSMTYAGFKSLLYAAVDREDPRVKGAFYWIRSNWDMDHNPNMPDAQSQEGLYYYYHIFAKALRAWGQPTIETDEGQVNWREELIAALGERIQPDGSWANPEDRWNEGSPVLVTSYAVLGLQEALKK